MKPDKDEKKVRTAGVVVVFVFLWVLFFAFFCVSTYSLILYFGGKSSTPTAQNGTFRSYTPKGSWVTVNDSTEYVEMEPMDELRLMLLDTDMNQRNFSDDFLLKFLNARLEDPHLALELIDGYFRTRRNHPEFFMLASKSFKEFQPQVFNFQKERTLEGEPLTYMKIANWDYKRHELSMAIASLVPFVEVALIRNPSQSKVEGLTVVDMRDWSWTHLFKVSNIQTVFELTEQTLPIRPGRTHVVYESWAVSKMFSLCKPFMSDDLKNKIVFHGEDLESLYEIVPRERLPKVLGGETELRSYSEEELAASDRLLLEYWNEYPAAE